MGGTKLPAGRPARARDASEESRDDSVRRPSLMPGRDLDAGAVGSFERHSHEPSGTIVRPSVEAGASPYRAVSDRAIGPARLQQQQSEAGRPAQQARTALPRSLTVQAEASPTADKSQPIATR